MLRPIAQRLEPKQDHQIAYTRLLYAWTQERSLRPATVAATARTFRNSFRCHDDEARKMHVSVTRLSTAQRQLANGVWRQFSCINLCEIHRFPFCTHRTMQLSNQMQFTNRSSRASNTSSRLVGNYLEDDNKFTTYAIETLEVVVTKTRILFWLLNHTWNATCYSWTSDTDAHDAHAHNRRSWCACV
jgi:hypothetical protein